jgi:hypothetical protein
VTPTSSNQCFIQSCNPGGGGGWSLRRGGHQTSIQNFVTTFFLLISHIYSRASHSSLRPFSLRLHLLLFLLPAGRSVCSLGQSQKKIFCQISPGRPNGSPPPPGECLNETLPPIISANNYFNIMPLLVYVLRK